MSDEKKATLNKEQTQKIVNMMETALLSRSALLAQFTDGNRDYDKECGYPESIEPAIYRRAYGRQGLAHRIVEIFPSESWALSPLIYETEDPEETPFEMGWNELNKRLNLLYHLKKIDEISGIGRFGILFLGFSDGKPMDQPVQGVRPDSISRFLITNDPMNPPPPKGLKLLYLRSFDESVVTITRREQDPSNPRFGQPVEYSVIFQEEKGTGETSEITTRNVHWSRVIHVADNRDLSEVYGTPRLQVVYNRIIDSKKIVGGSAEMFWKGAFPGLSFEVSPGVGESDLDTASLKEQLELYSSGLQRWLALVGVTAKSLSPQIGDPSPSYEVLITDICVALGVPKRVFMGSEQGELASSQDSSAWDERVLGRNNTYLTPMVIRPFVDRLIEVGVLPPPSETKTKNKKGEQVDKIAGYEVYWPPKFESNEKDEAAIALTRTQTLAAYVSGGVDQIIPPAEFLTIVMKFEEEEVEQIMKAAEQYAIDNPEPPPLPDPFNPYAAVPPGQQQGQEEKEKSPPSKESEGEETEEKE